MDDLGTEADDGDDAEGCLSGVRTSETGFIVGVGRKMLGFAGAFVVMGEWDEKEEVCDGWETALPKK